MAKKPKKRKEPHPTLFVWDGSIRLYEEGSMLELNTQVSPEEWETIVHETVKYKCFLECLKDEACPTLDERWSDEDDWFRVQLGVAISRMRNLDAILVASFNQKDIKVEYIKWMKESVKEVKVMIEQVREEQKEIIQKRLDDNDTVSVSDL